MTRPRMHRGKDRYAMITDCMVESDDGRLIGARTLDGSWDGLHVLACDTVRFGERVKVSVRVPRSSFWIEAEGRITRLDFGRRKGDRGAAFGVCLERMHGMDRLVWGTALRRLPKAVAKRGESRDYASSVERIAAE